MLSISLSLMFCAFLFSATPDANAAQASILAVIGKPPLWLRCCALLEEEDSNASRTPADEHASMEYCLQA